MKPAWKIPLLPDRGGGCVWRFIFHFYMKKDTLLSEGKFLLSLSLGQVVWQTSILKIQQASWGFPVKEWEWEREGNGSQTTPSPPTCSVPRAVLRDRCILLSSSHKPRVIDSIIITVIFIVSILQVGKLRLREEKALACYGLQRCSCCPNLWNLWLCPLTWQKGLCRCD